MDQKGQAGQVALIALLVLTIATTVGLSLIARSTTDTGITRNLEESARAFSAAEAGMETALRTGTTASGIIDAALGVTYSVTVASVSATPTAPLVFSRKTPAEETETIWLTNHTADAIDTSVPVYTAPSIDICWSSETTTPAIAVSVLFKRASDGTYQTVKGAYDPDGSRRTGAAANNFAAPTATVGGCGGTTNTTYKETVTFSAFSPAINPGSDILIAVRVRPVYSAANIAAVPAQILPFQGNSIVSTGTTGSGINRKIVVFQSYKSPASLFDAAVFSQGSFSH